MSDFSRFVACVTDRGVGKNYWQYFSCYELSEQDMMVSDKTLKKWRKHAPAHAKFIVRLDSALAKCEFKGEKAEQLWQKAIKQKEILQSELFFFHTPSSFRPSTENIENLRRFFKEHARDDFNIAWRADGLWEDTDLYFELCQELSIVPVIDPIHWPEDEDMPFGNIVYWRLMGRKGMSVRLSETDLENIMEWSDDASGEVYIILTSAKMNYQAKRWSALLSTQQNLSPMSDALAKMTQIDLDQYSEEDEEDLQDWDSEEDEED
jgi:uncharacterized protein YecE (DUF72 family)